MSDWKYSVVILVPASLRDNANLVAEKMGHGPNNFSVGLSADGSAPTWYGCRTQAKQDFVDMLLSAKNGQIPEISDVDPQIVGEVLVAMVVDISEVLDGYAHAVQVFETNGLVLANEEESL